MKEKSSFLKYLSIPILLCCSLLSFAAYMAWKENKMNNDLVENALKGNPYAIGILQKYEKPWKLDERLVYEALNGNKNAVQVLGIASLPSQ